MSLALKLQDHSFSVDTIIGIYKPSIHPSIFFTRLIQLLGSGGAGAYPSGHLQTCFLNCSDTVKKGEKCFDVYFFKPYIQFENSRNVAYQMLKGKLVYLSVSTRYEILMLW